MKETELRIGNLVFWYADGKNYETKVTAKDLADDTIYKNFEPIPLTEEILLKCGFSDNDYKDGYIGKDFKSGNMILDFVLSKPFSKGEWNDTYTFDLIGHRFVKLEFLHQLQNLYFALTGEELEINV